MPLEKGISHRSKCGMTFFFSLLIALFPHFYSQRGQQWKLGKHGSNRPVSALTMGWKRSPGWWCRETVADPCTPGWLEFRANRHRSCAWEPQLQRWGSSCGKRSNFSGLVCLTWSSRKCLMFNCSINEPSQNLWYGTRENHTISFNPSSDIERSI